jgi:hypothetical protein
MKFCEAKKIHCSCVYCLVFPNGKRYVGKTKDLGGRMSLYETFSKGNKELSSALVEFGFDCVDVSILSEVNNRNAVDLDLCLSILEVKYIREYGTTDADKGYNISFGGECLGIPIEYLTTDKDAIKRFYDGSKVILCYDLRGDFVEEHESIAKCAYHYGVDDETIRGCIGKMRPFADKYFLRFKRYDYVPKKIEVPVWEVRERVKYKNVVKERIIEKEVTIHTYAPALKYDMNGDFCGEYKSKRDACKSFLKNTTCDWGEYRNGYILFKKVSDDYPKKIEDYTILSKKQTKEYYCPASELDDIVFLKSVGGKDFTPKCIDGKYTNIKNNFPIAQYALNGDFVARHENIRDASHATGVPYSQIYACVMGKTRKAQGFVWKSEQTHG